MARDPLELRKFASTVPDDLNDPFRWGQLIETSKDALVLELRTYLEQSGFTTEEREELPNIEKYAIGYGAGLDPYATFVKIVQEYPDVLERLPHIAVTALSGANNRMGVGRPLLAHTQAPPRVVTANPEPYALADVAPQINTVTVTGAPADTYTVFIDTQPIAVTVAAGTVNDAATALAREIRTQVGTLYTVDVTAAVIAITRRDAAEAFTLTGSANLTIALVQAASVASSPDQLVYRTTPDRRNPVESRVVFAPRRFATGTIGALSAADIARVFNEQALYAQARVVPVGAGSGVQFETGGQKGGRTPNEIEILAGSTPSLVTALGLGDFGAAAGGDSLSGIAPAMTLNVVGAGFTTAMVGRYVTLSGAGVNDGRFLVTGAPSADALEFTNDYGVAAAIDADAAWFIGYRDDSKNPVRPVQNRYHMSAKFTIGVDVYAESPNSRREVADLIWTFFTFALEERFFTLLGRGVFDEAYPNEHWQISIAQETATTADQDFKRGDDQKNQIYAARITVPLTIWHYLDRQVLVPSGPSQGQSWTLESENVQPDDGLPFPS